CPLIDTRFDLDHMWRRFDREDSGFADSLVFDEAIGDREAHLRAIAFEMIRESEGGCTCHRNVWPNCLGSIVEMDRDGSDLGDRLTRPATGTRHDPLHYLVEQRQVDLIRRGWRRLQLRPMIVDRLSNLPNHVGRDCGRIRVELS